MMSRSRLQSCIGLLVLCLAFALTTSTHAQTSRYWVAQARENGAFLLWPEEFFIEYFHDDLSEGIGETVVIFKAVVNRMSAEFC